MGAGLTRAVDLGGTLDWLRTDLSIRPDWMGMAWDGWNRVVDPIGCVGYQSRLLLPPTSPSSQLRTWRYDRLP